MILAYGMLASKFSHIDIVHNPVSKCWLRAHFLYSMFYIVSHILNISYYVFGLYLYLVNSIGLTIAAECQTNEQISIGSDNN